MSKKLNISESVTPSYEIAPAITKSRKDMAKETLERLMKEETRLVKGIFQCFETPGSTVKIVLKKYPGIPHFEKEMTDGMSYEVPLYVARHLNGIDKSAGAASDYPNQHIGSCSYPIHGFTMSTPNDFRPSVEGMAPGSPVSGIPIPMIAVAKRVKRYGFQSLEFGASD